MNDTYVYKVVDTEDSGGFLHHCGTVSVGVYVECSMAEKLLYCPKCEVFWGVDQDYWADDKTKWEVEKPGPMSNFKELAAKKDEIISRMHGKLKVKDRLLSDAHHALVARDKEYDELLGKLRKYDDNEVRSRGPGKRGGRPEYLNEPEKAV